MGGECDHYNILCSSLICLCIVLLFNLIKLQSSELFLWLTGDDIYHLGISIIYGTFMWPH